MSAEWPSIADLLTEGEADIALLGAPLEQGSVTPGRCDLAPAAVRQAMKRIGTYDLEAGLELTAPVRDLGDLPVRGLMPANAFQTIREGVRIGTGRHALTILLGGNNAVTRPAAHGLGVDLDRVGLITLDAHFDLRGTDGGPRNGNPIRCLLEDGLPGTNICQIGLAPFANTARMHRDALRAGIGVWPVGVVLKDGVVFALQEAIAAMDHVEVIMVDFDIDVIDRSQFPGAPGARPGGMSVVQFFAAARWLAAQPKVRVVDLTEFDPSLDATDLSALTAARWVAELLAGYAARGPA